jgi:hypothetical protein
MVHLRMSTVASALSLGVSVTGNMGSDKKRSVTFSNVMCTVAFRMIVSKGGNCTPGLDVSGCQSSTCTLSSPQHTVLANASLLGCTREVCRTANEKCCRWCGWCIAGCAELLPGYQSCTWPSLRSSAVLPSNPLQPRHRCAPLDVSWGQQGTRQ